jgi:quinoprotein glucose dehydrogenase
MNAQSPAKPPVFTLWLLRLFAVVLGLFGFLLLLGGGWLAYYGGSFYYATAGALMIASAVLLFLRRRAGAWLYGLTLAFTIVWAIAEVGFDGWQLLPRLLIPVAFGLWIAMPWTQKPLTGRFAPAARVPLRATGLVGATALGSVALGTVLFFTVTERPADPLYQTGFGAFPQQARLSYDGIVGEDWPHFGGDESGGRYSPLTGITPENVSELEVAWEVDLGNRPAFNATPIKIGDTLYTCNNNNEVFALDAATGEQRWHFDASEDYGGSCRGVAYHAQPDAPAGQACAARIVTGTNMARLWALDAVTGEPCPDFGENGMVDLRVGMGDYQNEFIPGYYRVTSAPAVVRDRIVVGGWITDGQYWGQTSGVVRAFDAVTGEFAWAWDMGNPASTPSRPRARPIPSPRPTPGRRSPPRSWAWCSCPWAMRRPTSTARTGANSTTNSPPRPWR